jgi:long-subunit fatty acid transport protein
MKRPFFILLSFYLVSGAACYAASTGASFLDIGTSARAIAMGGAFVGVADDVSAMNYNPAGLEQIQEGGVVAQHTEWISDLSHDFIAAAFPTKAGTFGAGIVYLSQGTLDGRDSNGIANGMFGANDLAVTASYSRLLTESLAGGVNVKIIQETIANTTATGYAADMGILTPFLIPHLKAGVVVENIGPQLKFISEGYDLPASISAGVGYTLGPLLLALDVKQSHRLT